MMRNYKMIVAYDGTRYLGWEHQPHTDMTIQGKLEGVLSRMVAGNGSLQGEGHGVGANAATGSAVTVIGAGRTDAGVSARAMTCNVLLDTELSEEEIQAYLNRYLPDDISVSEVRQCADRFHARFKATGKTYRYTLWYAADGSKPVFDRRYVWNLNTETDQAGRPLRESRNADQTGRERRETVPADQAPDVDAMRAAAEYLVGMHDYKSFCGNSHFKKSSVRVIDTIRIEESGNYIRIYIHGSGFLQNMVRIITGTLVDVAYHRRAPEDMQAILEACDRRAAGPTAPAQGLCLMKVDY